MIRTDCPATETLRDFLLGQSSEMDSASVEVHLSICPHCLARLPKLETSDSFLATVQGGARQAAPPVNVRAELMTRLRRLGSQVGMATSLPRAHSVDDDRLAATLDFLGPAEFSGELGRIGAFGIQRVLGSGGTGIVFLAEQLRPRRMVALKMILADPWVSRERLERFRAESEILAKMRHPHIVQVLEVGEHDGRPFFTMEYAAGGSLAQKLAVASLTPRDAALLMQTLARATHAAHEQGVVHRDLKPSNVLLTADGTALIGDFGLAKYTQTENAAGSAPGGHTQTGAILGTPSYMAPEQARGLSNEIGPKADVYALGAILYECLTGRPPFKAASVLETLEQARTHDPVSPRSLQIGLPRDLDTICLKCLEKDPARRYATAQALADDLERFLAGKPILARRIRASERALKWSRRQPAAAALLAFSALAVLAAVIGVLVHSTQLRNALEKSEQNADNARRQQKLARGHYERARETLEKVLEEFEGLRLGEVPQLKELQRRQLEDALAFYQGAIDDQDDADPEIRADLALASKRAGDLQHLLGRHAEALLSFTRAIHLLEELPVEQREAPTNQFLLATCYNNRGLTANNTRRWDEAARDHLKALAIFAARRKANPIDPHWRAGLAETEHCLGALYQVSGKPAAAELHEVQAAALYTELVREQPTVESYLAKLADIEINLGLLFQTTNRFELSKRTYEQADQHLRSLLKLRPTSGDYRLSLGALYSNWGQLLSGLGDRKAALAKLDEAVEQTESVLTKEPNFHIARSRAINAHGARAQIYEALGRWADAVADWDRVVEMDSQPNPWLNKVFRTAALAQAGMHARATSEAQTLAKDAALPADGVYELACACALSAQRVQSDDTLDAAQRDKLAERYAAQAIDLLRRLHEQGYFQDAGHAKNLTTDDRLKMLRGRTDFKRLFLQSKGETK